MPENLNGVLNATEAAMREGDKSAANAVVDELMVTCPELFSSLEEFRDEIEGLKGPSKHFTDASWLSHIELVFVLKCFRSETLTVLRRVTSGGPVANDLDAKPQARKAVLQAIWKLLNTVQAHAADCLQSMPESAKPAVLRLSHRYGLSSAETELFQLLFMKGATKSPSVLGMMGKHRGSIFKFRMQAD